MNALMKILFKSKTKRSKYWNTRPVENSVWKACRAAVKIWWKAANLEGIKSNPTNGPKVKAKAITNKLNKKTNEIYAWKPSQTKNMFSENSKSNLILRSKIKRTRNKENNFHKTFLFEKFQI